MRAACGFADLLELEAALGEDRLPNAARLAGFETRASDPPQGVVIELPQIQSEATAFPPPPGLRAAIKPPFQPIPFWRVTWREPLGQLDERVVRPGSGLTDDDQKPAGDRPRAPDLIPWPRLRQRLHMLLGTPRQGRAIDQGFLLRRVVRREPISRAPRALQKRFPRALWLVGDRAGHLIPCWEDFDRLEDRLARLLPGRGLVAWTFDRGPLRGTVGSAAAPVRGAPMLILSDLGAYGDAQQQADWHRFIQSAIRQGHAPHFLLPVPRDRWPGIEQAGRAEVWDRSRHACAAVTAEDRAISAGRLLRVLAWLTFVEPGLLRAARFAMTARAADVGTEVDAWNRFARPHVDGGTLSTDLRHSLLATSLGEPEVRTLARLLPEVQRWRQAYTLLVGMEERLVLRATSPPELHPLAGASETEDTDALKRLLKSLEHAGDEPLADWVKRVWTRAPQAVRDDETIGPALAEARRRAGAPVAEPRPWLIRQLRPDSADSTTVPSPSTARGEVRPPDGGPSFIVTQDDVGIAIGEIVATSVLWAPLERGRLVELAPDTPHRLPSHDLLLTSDRERVRLERFMVPKGIDRIIRTPKAMCVEAGPRTDVLRLWWRPPAEPSTQRTHGEWHPEPAKRPGWAHVVGCDDTGIWAAVNVAGVTIRFRRIPAGRFLMGSPQDEDERWEDEVQHEVAISGFWLADTPVTQALWQGLTRENPSRFQSPDRPIEQVSWEDSVAFIERLNQVVPGLEARLPTEAEWEFACRAGEELAIYTGDLEIFGANNAPALDPIAWYGGNSGVGFELDDGWDSTDWPDKQYPHRQAGTHPVAQKLPNAFGLYDMLGNVWEWCSDWLGPYPEYFVRDPRGSVGGGTRVLRGGSWHSVARHVRVADRGAFPSGDRRSSAGFRLARGQEAAAGPPAPAVEEAARGRGTRRKKRGLFGRKRDE